MLSDQVFHILAALAGGVRHGYAIISDVAELSNGQIRLGPGTLYTALSRLLDDEVVSITREEKEEGRLRRYYRLTAKGRSLLSAELVRREGIVHRVRRMLPVKEST